MRPRHLLVLVYRDRDLTRRQYRWVMFARTNGRIVATSGEGFNSHRYATLAADNYTPHGQREFWREKDVTRSSPGTLRRYVRKLRAIDVLRGQRVGVGC